jgi:hypothetical protein
MTTAKTKRWVLVDAPVERLLDAIGAPDLHYYRAGEERAVNEALRAWPLLATVARALREDGARKEPTKGAEQPLRVVVENETADDVVASPKEAG